MSLRIPLITPVTPDYDRQETSGKQKTFKHREERISLPKEIESKVTISSSDNVICMGTLIDISTFGAKVQFPTDECFLATNTTSPVKIWISSQKIFDGNVRVISEVSSGANLSFGIAFVDSNVDTDQIKGILGELDLRPKLAHTKSIYSISSQIRDDFKTCIADLNTLYQDLKVRLNEEEKHLKDSATNEKHQKRLEEHAINLAMSLYSADFNEVFARFQKIVDQFSPEEHALHKKYFRANFKTLVDETPFMKRALEKPLGYAGDYGLMVMFYEYADLGGSLFHRFFHRFACNQPAAVANKNRVEFLSQLMNKLYERRNVDGAFKVSSIACGPARELQLFLEDGQFKVGAEFDFVIADQEPLALDYASKSIRKLAQERKCNLKLSALREDVVLGLIKRRPLVNEFQNSDVIISAGLFDYLSDRVSIKLIEALYDLLKPGGELIIGNVSDKNPDRFSMDYFMEWNLILRSPKQLLDLVSPDIRKNSAVKYEVTSESLGLNLFLRITKPI